MNKSVLVLIEKRRKVIKTSSHPNSNPKFPIFIHQQTHIAISPPPPTAIPTASFQQPHRSLHPPPNNPTPPPHSPFIPLLHTLHQPRKRSTTIPRPQPGRKHHMLEPIPAIQSLVIQELSFEKLIFLIRGADIVVQTGFLPPFPPWDRSPELRC